MDNVIDLFCLLDPVLMFFPAFYLSQLKNFNINFERNRQHLANITVLKYGMYPLKNGYYFLNLTIL